MCGRYRAKTQAGEIQRHWTVPANERADAPMGRDEVKPTTTATVLRSDGERLATDGVRWGIQPHWSKRPLLNARSDKLEGSRLWKGLLADPGQRVLFVADGWYEWLRPEQKGKAKPQPYLHLVEEGELFGMGGLRLVAQPDGETVDAVTVVTTEAVGESARLHHRMPVVLPDRERQQAWLTQELSSGDLAELCVGLADGVSIQPVTL